MASQKGLALNAELGDAAGTVRRARATTGRGGRETTPQRGTAPQRVKHVRTVTGGLWRLASSNTILALLDQSVVSGTRFLTTIIIGRLCGPAELGVYSLAFAVALFAACAQEALVANPYTVYGNRFAGAKRARYAGSVLVHYAVLAFIIVAVLTTAAGIATWASVGPDYLGQVLLVLAVITPGALLWEFGRRMAFAHLHLRAVVLMDVALAMLQIGFLTLLARSGLLSVANALLAVGLASSVVGLSWLYFVRKRFVIRFVAAVRDWRKNWSFGRWFFGGQILGLFHGYSVPWALAALLGTTATGVFTACQTIALLSNPIILGFGNMLMPSAARAHAHGGASQVAKVTARALLAMLLLMGCFSTVLILRGEEVLTLFFGSQYTEHGYLVGVIGTCTLAWAASSALSCGLAALERSRAVFASTLSGLAMTLVVAVPLTHFFDLLGGAITLLLGSFVSAALLGWMFVRAVRCENS